MSTLDYTQANLTRLITHHVGNKQRDEGITLSAAPTEINDDSLDYLLAYFLQTIKVEEFYSFAHSVQLEMNEVYTTVSELFTNPKKFVEHSQSIAKLLYEQSTHPKIKEGELNIALFNNMVLDNQTLEAIGIFKSETDAPFIKMKSSEKHFTITHDMGFELKSIDKGCLIFNTGKENGYRLLIIDAANKAAEAQYWKDDFLNVKPINDEFHQTNQFLGIAKNFVTKQIAQEFDVSKADRIDLLNRSVAYFKTHDNFDKAEFEEEVFKDKSLIKSFRDFDNNYRESNAIELDDSFEISPQAVKKQARVFKSVLKLDKNFHVYIHGDRSLIQQGVENDGRKYYKIYFEQEL
ncbi:MAG: hypothetical protein POELPBGB_00745 [Bacteroidia bacterium]|nr:hypothetical protein [Bacteroidia bacterium]